MPSVLQKWVEKLSIQKQTTLISAIRSCDNEAKENSSLRIILSYIRGFILKSSSEVPNNSFLISNLGLDEADIRIFSDNSFLVLRNYDHLPVHYLFHLMHACEVIAYDYLENNDVYQEEQRILDLISIFYFQMCKNLHVNPETKEEYNKRLTKYES